MAGKPVAASFRCGCWLLWVLVVVGLCVPVGGGPPGFRCCLLLVAPRVFRVPSGPAAREIATREPTARSRRSRSLAKLCRRPPAPRPGSAGHAGLAVPSMREPAARSRRSRSLAKPSGPSGTLHTGGAFHCCAHPIQAPPPTGAAAKPHSQAPRASRFPPCVNLRLGVVDLEARPSPPAPPAPSTPVGLFIAVHIPSRPRRPRAPRPSPTARPLLSRSSRVALHTGGAWCAGG